MKKVLLFALCLMIIQLSVVQAAETDGVTASGELQLLVSTLPEMKLGFTEHFTFPFLQGKSPLTEGNNIDLALTAELSPISLNGVVEAVWTPIAFFQLAAGGRIGSGWNLELFNNEIRGIGINRPIAGGKAETDGKAFDGLLYKKQLGIALQADAAAFFPGDWNHVVFRTYHEINYKGYTRAGRKDAWFYENDDGENCIGHNYYGNILIGYQMPIMLDFVALLAEMDLYLYDTPDRGKWGDDKIRWTFSAIGNLSFTRKISLSLITQFRTRRNYNEPDWEDLYYRNRTIDNSSPLHLEFYRVAAALTYKL